MSAIPADATGTGKTLLIRNATCVATFDDARTELRDASVLVRGHRIESIGPAAELPAEADEVIDARGHLVMPGLVNTHHHMFQSLTRAVPGVQDAELFSWLRGLYPIWARLTPEMVRVSSQLAMAELPALGLHHQQRPSLHLSRRRAAGRQHRGRHRDRHALRGHPRQHERGRVAGRPASGPRGGARGCDPGRHATRHRTLPRQVARRDGERGRGAVLAVQRQPRPDARVGQPRARLRRAPAHAPGRERPRHRLQPSRSSAARPRSTRRTWAGPGPTCGMRTASSSTPRASHCSPGRPRASPTAPAATCAWPRASRPSGACWTLACRWDWAWTAAPATTARRWWPRRARPCCWRGWVARWSRSAATTGRPR